MPRVKVKRRWVVRKCSNCGVPGHQRRTCKAPMKFQKLNFTGPKVIHAINKDYLKLYTGTGKTEKPPANGQPTLDGYREHGVQWLKDRREILLQQVDQVDAALKLMS